MADHTPSGERRTLAGQIATRERSWDGWGMADWLPNPDPVLKALGKDISTYRDLRSDAHIGGCIRRRKAAVRGLEPVLERAGCAARIHKAVEGILADLYATPDPDEPGAQPGLPALIAESQDGALYGYQPHEIIWQRVGRLLVPTVVQGKPPEWFCFDGNNQLRFKARGQAAAGELLPARKFLLSRQDGTYQNPYGFPDLSMCFWPGTLKRGGLKFWAKFVEKYGGAWALGKLPRSASPTEYEALTDSLYAMIEDAVAAIPDDGSVEIMTSSGTAASTDAHHRFLLYCRSEIATALLGTNQGTEQTSTVASATAALEVADDIRDGDARMTEAVINQLIRWIVETNWPGQAAPRWELQAEERIDKTRAERDKLLKEAGVVFSATYWCRTYDLEEDDLAEPPEQPEDPEDPADAMDPEDATDPQDPGQDAPDPVALAAAPDTLTGPDYAQAQTARLGTALEPIIDGWLARIRGHLDAAIAAGTAPAAFAAELLTRYPELPSDEFAAVMGEALAAAHLGGRQDLEEGV